MKRVVTFEVPADSSLFTPSQLQPRAAFWFAMTGWARWLRAHWVPFPRLIRDHRLGVVIASLDLEYIRPFGFFDADALVVSASLVARRSGNLLILSIDIAPSGGSAPVARVTAVLRPVRIGDGTVLSATPASLDAATLATFLPDEIVNTGPPRRARALVAGLEASREPVAVHSKPFTVHRHLCEAADQWSGIALCDLAEEVRDELVSRSGISVPALGTTFVEPMRRITLEFRRAAFFLDELVIECRAFEHQGQLLFVHRCRSAVHDEELATFVESYPASATERSTQVVEDVHLLQQGGK